MWWIITEKWKGEIYYAGYGGNYIVVDHANDLVVVTRWMDDRVKWEVYELVNEISFNKLLKKNNLLLPDKLTQHR
jgi:CO/xanthine dehydrogenase FAD-binding subunit